MIDNKYELAYVDGSFLLTRSLWISCKGKRVEEFNPGEVVKICIQSINKMARDNGVTADKVILIFDKWSPEYEGYYRSWLIKNYVKYKGSRKYITQEDLNNLMSTPGVTPEEIQKATRELAISNLKYAAKDILMNMGSIGLWGYRMEGYEFDDIATIASFQRYQYQTKKDVIVTSDSDLKYSVTPKTDLFRFKTSKNPATIITYDEMYEEIPEEIRKRGVSLYQYKAFLESLSETHNDMIRTKKSGVEVNQAILSILDGDYSVLENKEAFEAQMSTFDLSKFPNLQEVQRAIHQDFLSAGKHGTIVDFHKFCFNNGISGISDRYYSELSGRFDTKLFSE